MTWLSDAALARLREVAEWPDLSGTKYEVLARIDQGGMGTVYRARDRDLERDVALKVLTLADPSERAAARVLREARILAQLEHPAIVPVHDVGRLADGRVYYVMKRVRGRRLDVHVREAAPGLRERLGIFLRLCEAAAFAHAHGVVHRDLKPENVMVGPFGEVLVMDWGVAKILAEAAPAAAPAVPVVAAPDGGATTAPGVTAQGTVLGTPGYMAPEQARGDVEAVDARADIWALGAILHFLLAGRPPAAAGLDLDASVPRPLRAVCLTALAPAPEERYASVPDLAEDVSCFVAGLPVRVYRENLLERAQRLGARYRIPLLLVLAYLVMRLVVLAATQR
jgi:serine/threonine protein kinase